MTEGILTLWQIWIILSIIFVIFEIFTTGFFFFCFAIGALLTAIPAYLNFSLTYQLVIFSAISFIILITFRKAYLSLLTNKNINNLTNVNALIGKNGVVLKEINGIHEKGIVKINGEEWSAIANNNKTIEKGSKVEILKIDGNKVIVKKIHRKEN